MNKTNISLTCLILEIGEEQKFNRTNKKPFSKRMVSLQTSDGQKLFAEVRKMYLLDGIHENDIVDVKISFAGSEKNNKKYNNIFINGLKKK